MAITNKEILENQVRRINEKMKTEFVLKRKPKGLWYLCRIVKDYELEPAPLAGLTYRTTQQMMEYLRGVEDAVDVYTHCGTAERV